MLLILSLETSSAKDKIFLEGALFLILFILTTCESLFLLLNKLLILFILGKAGLLSIDCLRILLIFSLCS